MLNIPEIFGSMVFSNDVMKIRLPEDTYKAVMKTISEGKTLDINVANIVASAMKDWALEKGATHFTHWFQPMTGITAEKHDSFISPSTNGNVIMEFSGKELVKGEPDASSFPSGGIRATFEARGYTAWDPTSYAFIKDNTLCIPTAFCSYGGETLDKKTPLLRSMEALNKQSLRVLKLFNDTDIKRVIPSVGAEQEYFLIDKEMFEKRPDLIYCGRTLFGAKPPKGQDLDDHYFGTINPRVASFMEDLDEELWKLGVFAKTEHNEVAPGQHELAPIFTTVNIATDHNQLTMELMKKIATKHNLACLLHEKPFKGINGSGKHNNWSLTTDTGLNLLRPGKTPSQNARFLLFLVAIIKAVDDYQDLLRISVASAGNDHRLGANEAPPAIMSIFLGDELTEILEAIESKTEYEDRVKDTLEIGVSVLPNFPIDTTDRNRTSPFAFTGNKFEFRMLGSAFSIACTNYMLNTMTADILSDFADTLEISTDFKKDLNILIRKTIREHKRIIFNGNNYSEDWVEEAKKRGLPNRKTTVDALPLFTSAKNITLFEKHGVLSSTEINSRQDILLEHYSKTINIEALTIIDMVKKGIIPSVIGYSNRVAEEIVNKKKVSENINCEMEGNLLNTLSNLSGDLNSKLTELEELMCKTKDYEDDILGMARYYCDSICTAMESLRTTIDMLEENIDENCFAYPSYAKILYSVK